VTDGDRRCIRYGILTEEAMRELAVSWDIQAPIDQRLGAAVAALHRQDMAAGDEADDLAVAEASA
jgi:tRNA A-37 threonylcarbamoyl transferase component Bud32